MEGKVQAQSYSLPAEMSGVLSATIAETSQGEVILCHDTSFLFAARVVRGGGNVTFQKFALPSVWSLAPVIKNYFMAVLQSRKLVVFQVAFNEDGKIMLRFIFNRERPFASTFLREVAPNMAELHICFPDNEIVVHQFTVNGKVGVMTYQIGAQNKLEKCDRAQLYASKSMFCEHRRCIYYFNNFSSKVASSFSLAKLETELAGQNGHFPLAYLSKMEDFYVLMSNYTVVNVMNTSLRHKIYCEEKQTEIVQKLADPKEIDRYRVKDGTRLKVSTYLDMILVQDGQRAISYIFQVKPKGSNLIGLEYGKINWFWTGSRKLVGLSHDRTTFKIIDEIRINDRPPIDNPFITSLNTHSRKDFKARDDISPPQQQPGFIINKEESPPKNAHSAPGREEHMPPSAEKSPLKSEQQAIQLGERFKPMKIIQKNKVSVSKTVHKSKEIQPISQEEEKANQKQEEPEVVVQSQPKQTESQKIQPKKSDPVQEEDLSEQKRQEEKEGDTQIDKKVQEQCQKMANAILDQDSPQKQPNNQQEEVEIKGKEREKESDEASVEQVEQKQEGDAYPKEDSELSDSIVLPGKQEQDSQEQKEQKQPEASSNPVLPAPEAPKQEESKQSEGSLPKSLAVLIGKSNLGGQYSHPLNLFNTSINRNNIFGSILRHETVAADPSLLRRHRSEDEYYNPFTSSSPCPSPTKEKQTQSEQVVKEDSAAQQNAEMLARVKELFQETTTRLLKAIDDLANQKSSQPYLKDKMVEQLRRCVRQSMQRMMVGQFTSRIQRYFYQVFRQTDQVQQESIKFYKEASNHRASNVETHLNNQEKLIRQIRDIESNLRFCISHMKDNTRATFQALMRDWQTQAHQTKKLVDAVTAARVKVEAEEQARARRYDETKQSLEAIKILLAERINMEAEKRQRKIDRERQKQLEKEAKAKKDKKKRGDKKAVKK